MQAAVGLGTGTTLGDGRGRIQKGHGKKRSRVDSFHPGSVPETVELPMAVFTLERVQFVSSVLCMRGQSSMTA